MSATLPRYIVDASIAIKWLLDDEDFTAEARAILDAFQEGEVDLLAPDHLYHEALNALRTGVRMERLRAHDAEEVMHAFLDLGIPTVVGSALFVPAFGIALAYNCAFYDGLYLALANETGSSLVHADRRLLNTLQGRFTGELWIEDYGAAV